MNVYSLLPNRRPRASLLAGLLVGLVTQHALAAEEVVAAAGTEPAAQAGRELLQDAMMEYARSINEEIRATLEDSLRQQPKPQLQLAAIENSTRG